MTKDDLIRKMMLTAGQMRQTGFDIEVYFGCDDLAMHGRELINASSLMYAWVDEFENDSQSN